jgi:protein TonB
VAAPVKSAVPAPQKSAGETRDSYLGRLLGQLNRFKQYPRAARQAHIEGVVMLHFVMDADGRVQSFEISKSSGRPVLDAEALALIQRAQPLPALPADYPTRTLDAIVPIEFSLRT